MKWLTLTLEAGILDSEVMDEQRRSDRTTD